jgi:hypothetical protein
MQANVHVVEALWIFHLVIEIPLAGIMYRRKLHRQFPVFFAYILFQVVGFAILFPLYLSRSSADYFFAYWINAIACWVFGFKVIHEVFSDVFRLFPALKDMGTMLFRWGALMTPLLMFVILASSSSGSDALLRDGLIGTERCVRFIQCALILFLLLFSSYLGVSWRKQSIGIALGYGWFAGIELFAFMFYYGGAINHVAELLNTVAYSLTLIVWIAYVAFPASNTLPNFRNPQDLSTVDGGTF